MRRLHCLTAVLLLAANAAAQRRALTLDDVIAPSALSADLPALSWIPDTTALAVPGTADDEPAVFTLDAAAGERARPNLAFTAGQLRAALERAGAELDPNAPPPAITWRGPGQLRVVHAGAVFHWTVDAAAARRVLSWPADATAVAAAAGDRAVAFVAGGQLSVVRDDGRRRQLTWDGGDDIVYGGAAHRAEFGITDGLWWDRGGRYLAFYREDQRPIEAYPYVDYSVTPPRPVHGRYPMAGRRDSIVTVGVYDREDDSVRYLEHDDALDLYWTNVTFAPDGEQIYVALVDRGQTRLQLVRFRTRSGARDAIVLEESDPKWIEPEHGPQFVPGGDGGFLWFSARDGWRHLYRYGAGQAPVVQVTSGRFDVDELVGFTADGRQALLLAGVDDPLQRHLLAADLDTGELRRLTTARGWHSCALSPDGASVLDQHTHAQDPGTIDLLALADGARRQLLRAADPTAGLIVGEQRFFQVKASDGSTLHGHLLLPPDFDPTRRHPVLLYVYGGPHSQLVRDVWLGGAQPWLVYMATQGFVVCRLDNRGTSNRGLGFAQQVYRRLGTLEVEDQLAAVRYLRSLPFVDAGRIGVHGWSYGGYMTLNLMLRAPAVFACGVAGAPVTDWAQYETGYTERYMDTPAENPDGYAAASCVARAAALRGRLLLVHGTDDRTVMLSQALAFVDACIAGGVLFDFLPYPMQQHGLRGDAQRRHLLQTMTRFFAEHLMPSRR